MRWIQDFAMKAESPVDEAAMAQRLNHNTAIQQERIKGLVEAQAAETVVGAAS